MFLKARYRLAHNIMRGVMGNLLETDSDVASASDNEKERTDGDGMEMESSSSASGDVSDGPLFMSSSKGAPELPDNNRVVDNPQPGPVPDACLGTTNTSHVISTLPISSESLSGSCNNYVAGDILPQSSSNKPKLTSPRELPPRRELIQLKPVMFKPSTSRNTDSSPENMNKQRNPKFVPYEPYKGAVRPIIADNAQKKQNHSRTASETSGSSSTFDVLGLTTNDAKVDAQHYAVVSPAVENQNTQDGCKKEVETSLVRDRKLEVRLSHQEQVILKHTQAFSMVKERLKIAEKDNNELHKENVRLKKLLVDSLSGDVFKVATNMDQDASSSLTSAQESVETLTDEIEVWRSKFLSSCVLVEQLTRENGLLNEAIGSAANIFRELKLSNSLPLEQFDAINNWLRSNRPSTLSGDNNALCDDS